jgi:cobalt/nickel transport system permease protein
LITLIENTADIGGRVDPRVKIVLLILFIITMTLTPVNQPVRLASCAVFLAMVIILTRLPLLRLLRSILKIYPMILLISLLQLVNAPDSAAGQAAPAVLPFQPISTWWTVLGFQIKLILLITATFIFIFTTPLNRLITSLQSMKLPEPFVSVTFFIYHFINMLDRELNRIHIALRSRYIKLPMMQRISLIQNVMIMYFLRLFDSNERLYRLLISRGFNGTFRFNMPLSWKRADALILTGGTMILITINLLA